MINFLFGKLSSHWLPRVNKRFEQQVGLNTAKNKNKLPEIECLLPKTVELEGFPWRRSWLLLLFKMFVKFLFRNLLNKYSLIMCETMH